MTRPPRNLPTLPTQHHLNHTLSRVRRNLSRTMARRACFFSLAEKALRIGEWQRMPWQALALFWSMIFLQNHFIPKRQRVCLGGDINSAPWEPAMHRILRTKCTCIPAPSRLPSKFSLLGFHPLTYDSFIYGGNTDNDDSDSIATLSSVYILTLPAFQWLQVPTPAETWRNNHKCQKIGQSTISQYNQRQFLSIGGIDSPQHTSWVSYTDEWTSAMKIFDLTALTWSDSYDPDAKAYTRPDIVEQVYSGGTKFPPV